MKKLFFYMALGSAAIIIFVALFAEQLAPFDPQYIHLDQKLQFPNTVHWLGTDHLGRDVLSRLIYGTRLSLSIVLIITSSTLMISIPIGTMAGFFGGKFDQFYLWVVDVMMAFPSFLLSMALVGILGQGIENMVIAVVVIDWIYYARIVRSIVYQVKTREYIQVATSFGASRFYLLRRHIFPFVIKPILVAACANAGHIILMISGFSFLGIGVQPNFSEWGMMLNDARAYFRTIPSLVLFPGVAIFITVMTFNILGDYFGKNN